MTVSGIGGHALAATENDRWFMNALVRIRLSKAESAAGISVLEHLMRQDFEVPAHRHDEDESFYILEGRLQFHLEGQLRELATGDVLHAGRGMVHAFRVLSPTARFLTVTTGSFEDMVRAASTPAQRLELPPQKPLTDTDLASLAALCREHGIEFL